MASRFLNLASSLKGRLLPIALCLVTYWLCHQTPGIQSLEWQLQDIFIAQRTAERPASKDIVIIDIDDTSLTALSSVLGKWPWPRSAHAELIEYLSLQQPKAIALDFIFSEPDIYRPHSDAYFAEVLQASSNIFLATATQQTTQQINTPLLMSFEEKAGLIRSERTKEDARGIILLPALPSEANQFKLGSIDLLPDPDGVTRKYHIKQSLEGWQLLSLPAKMASHLGYTLPEEDAIVLDWYSGDRFPHQRLSYAQMLSQARGEIEDIPGQFFKDKIIIIGTTALGLHDLRATPIDEFYPGVFILSTAVDNIINQQSLSIFSSTATIAISLLAMLSISVLFTLHYVRGALLFAIVFLAAFLGASKLGTMNGLIIEVVPTLVALAVLLAASLSSAYIHHRKELQKTIQIFSRFMDPNIVNALLDNSNPEELLTTKNVEVTMLFSDIRNFTSISETRTPGEMVSLLNSYFDKQVDTLFKHKATLDKFIGDAIMAFWGAPLEHDQHPIYAINAALDMVDNLERFIKEYGYDNFDIGIGIHTGDAVVGLVGSHERYDYTAIGDTVNLASRIEGLTKGRARVLVSETTKKIAEEHFDFVPQGEFQVKGRSKSVKVFEPLRKMESNDDA